MRTTTRRDRLDSSRVTVISKKKDATPYGAVTPRPGRLMDGAMREVAASYCACGWELGTAGGGRDREPPRALDCSSQARRRPGGS
jgi:hypothetical protein